MKTRQDFVTEEEYQEYYDAQFELPTLPDFEILDAIKSEKQGRQEELNRKTKVLKEEQSKLGALKAKVNNLILSGANESELDKIYDEIAKQGIIVNRRANELETITQAKETTKYNQAQLAEAFRKYKGEYEASSLHPEYEKLSKLKQEYLEAFNALEQKIVAFNERAQEVDRELNRLHRLQGGVIYGSTSISVKYDDLDVRVPRHKEVW